MAEWLHAETKEAMDERVWNPLSDLLMEEGEATEIARRAELIRWLAYKSACLHIGQDGARPCTFSNAFHPSRHLAW